MAKIFKCPVCGKLQENPPYYCGCCSDECFTINFWRKNLDESAIIIKGCCYHIGPEPDDLKGAHYLGFAGREFKIRKFSSNEIITTHNLWHQGEVPKEFHIEDNAEFIKN